MHLPCQLMNHSIDNYMLRHTWYYLFSLRIRMMGTEVLTNEKKHLMRHLYACNSTRTKFLDFVSFLVTLEIRIQ